LNDFSLGYDVAGDKKERKQAAVAMIKSQKQASTVA